MASSSALQAFVVGMIAVATAEASCKFEGLLSTCALSVGGMQVQATARINHCHTPIDITFEVESIDDPNLKGPRAINWRYTYVTSNHPESLDIAGSGRRIMLHVAARVWDAGEEVIHGQTHRRTPVRIAVKGQFLVDGHATDDLKFIEDEVRIPHFEDCAVMAEADAVGRIAMGCILTVIILCALGLACLGLYHRRRHSAANDDQEGLVNNMEQTARPSRPSRTSLSRDHEPNVHYVVPRKTSDTADSAANSNELHVFVSTSNGLRPIQRTTSAASRSTSTSEESRRRPTLASTSLSAAPGTAARSSPPSSPSETSASPASSLGAIPKRRTSLQSSRSAESSNSDDSAATIPSR